ncbi:uncharacterized protein G2W53_014159 [Senna tora]|uniref:Uncharacterized protein n=1 Tax=Senna tora TaxID=362788 RepID=A0A835C5Y9_9FABA|nr:uncharacterized protein G2W53_014159 [Senna tora]
MLSQVLDLILQVLYFVSVRSKVGALVLMVIVRVSYDLCAGLAGFLDLLELIVFDLLRYG